MLRKITLPINYHNHDIKETWKILNSALGRRSKTTTIQRLRVNGTDLTEPDKISEQFNKYFCNIASDILKESEEFDSSDISIESYITKLPKTFRFKRISPADVLHHVGKLKSSRSGAIPTRFLNSSDLWQGSRILILEISILPSFRNARVFLDQIW